MNHFFFQAEDGIPFGHVTGIQMCALPIWLAEQVRDGALPAIGLQLRPTTDRGAVDFAHVQSGWTSYPGVQIFEQSRTEEMLSSALAAEGRPVRWGHRLVALHEGAEEIGRAHV